MSERNIIPIADERDPRRPVRVPSDRSSPTGRITDRWQRPLRDLRISVTDRCNFRCSYCMPKDVFDREHQFLPQSALLTFEEITRVARLFLAHGVRKIRLTGGEPLLRKGLEHLVEMLASLRTVEGLPPELTLTTNGSLLARKARALRDAGLQRVTVSLDSLDDTIFRRMNDVDFPVAEVLAGIEMAQQVGLGPVKVNMVVKRGTNEGDIVPMVRHFRHSGVVLRFIEYMDVGATNGWRMDEVLPSDDVRARIDAAFPLEPLPASAPGETASRWRQRDGGGELGFISSVTQAFCGDCNRARLSTEGLLYLCLFGEHGHDLRSLLRGTRPDGVPWSDNEVAAAIAGVWEARDDRYSLLRAARGPDTANGGRRVEMSYIGG